MPFVIQSVVQSFKNFIQNRLELDPIFREIAMSVRCERVAGAARRVFRPPMPVIRLARCRRSPDNAVTRSIR
jgi:hypothetical protein